MIFIDLDNIYLKCILYHCNNITDFINLKEVLPHKKNLINKCMVYLTSHDYLEVDLFKFNWGRFI